MISDLGIPITLWNLILFGLLAVGVAVVVVLFVRWVGAKPTPKPDRTRENLEAWHAERDRRPKRPNDRSR